VLARASDAERVPMFGVMGRMAPSVSEDRVRAELEAVVAALWSDRGRPRPPAVLVQRATGFGVPPAARGLVMRGSVLIFGLMGLLIAVAAANVAALVLARAAGRRQEIGVRLALGASRGRLTRQLLTESLVLAGAGGLLGALLASWATRLLAARMTTRFEYVSYAVDIQPDLRVLAYTSAVVVATAILFGLAPVWHAARVDLVDVLKRSSSIARRRGTSRTLRGLVVGQFAVSSALLVGCGLLVRTYINTQQADPGIVTANIVAASIDLDQLRLDAGGGRRVFRELLSRVTDIPGVVGASLSRHTPLAATTTEMRVTPEAAVESASFAAGVEVVTAEHFQLLRIPLVQGRTFLPNEPDLPLTAIVNETMARRIAPVGTPVGRRFSIARGDGVLGGGAPTLEVVGVVKDVKHGSITEPPRPVFYQPFAQAYSPRMTLLVQVREPAAAMLDPIRRQVQSANGDLAIMDLRTLDDHRETASAFRRQAAAGLSIVSGLGLVLSSLGLFGVVSYSVRERAREFGIRLALGARAADVRWMVVRQGFALTLAGLAIGMAASVTLTGVLRSLLFGVGARDPLTIAVVCVVLSIVSLVALYVPARWATALEPAAVLRSD
jgi:predicted permease